MVAEGAAVQVAEEAEAVTEVAVVGVAPEAGGPLAAADHRDRYAGLPLAVAALIAEGCFN